MSVTRDDGDFAQEIESHLALEADELVREGASSRDARDKARQRFGNVTTAQERYYESRRVLWADQLAQDVRAAVRSSIKSRGAFLVALLSLSLGIGATTAIVSTLDAVLIRPLPYKDPDHLVTVWEDMTAAGFPLNTPAPANYLDWLTHNRVFEDMAATFPARANLTGDGTPERVLGRRVTANFFSVLGVEPALGRTFTEQEDRQNAPVVVISHRLWQRRYAGDPGIVGRVVTMNDQAATVLGVMPASFVFRDREMEFWAPIAFTPAQRAMRNTHVLNVVGRLRPGTSLEMAQAHMRDLAAELARDHRENDGVGVALVSIRDEVFGDTRQQLLVLAIAAGCLLLLMCANLANLLIARASTRQRELATRAALGAGRLRLISLMVSEGVIWSLLGGALGVAVAALGLEVLNAMLPASLADTTAPQLDQRLLLIAVALSLLCGIGFSLLPALSASRVRLNDALRESRGELGSGSRTRAVLITAQVAVSFVLLVGAALMLQSLANLRAVDLGFRPEGLLTVNTTLPDARYNNTRRAAFYQRVVTEVTAMPGVVSAGFGSTLPFLSRGNTAGFRLEGRTTGPSEPGDALFRITTTDYLRTLGVTLLAGRLPRESDTVDTSPVVVINKSFADLYWPTGDAIGRRLALSNPAAPWMTVIGIVADVRENGYEIPLRPGMYALATQLGFAADNLVIRTTGDPLALAPTVRRIVAGIDPDQPVAAVRSMDGIIDVQVVDRRQQSIVLATFALTAFLLASIGIYGLVSFSVTARRREVGLRTAFGASVSEVTRSLVKQGIVLISAGLVIGLAVSLAAMRGMEGLLFGVQSQDPMTLTAIGALVCVASLSACCVPAWRAARLHPMVALRHE